MQFKNLLLTGCLSWVSAAALAWDKPAAPERQSLITDGVTEQYFYNVGSGMFFVGANDYETRASLSETLGAKVKLEQTEMCLFSIWNYVYKYNEFRKMFCDSQSYIWVDNNNGANCNSWNVVLLEDDKFLIINDNYFGEYLGTTSNLIAVDDTRLYFTTAETRLNAGGTDYDEWYSVNEEEYNKYIEGINLYYTAAELKEEIDDAKAEYSTLDLSAEEAVYNNEESTIDQLKAAISSVISKMKEKAGENASLDNPVNFTKFIVNPSFEEGNLSGWTVNTSGDTGAKESSNATYYCDNADGGYLFNTWDEHRGYPISQTIEGLPNGVYMLKGMVSSTTTNAYIFANGGMNDANGNEVDIHQRVLLEISPMDDKTETWFTEGELWFVVDGGSVTIGAVGAAADGVSYVEGGYSWYKADNFQLIYYGNKEDVYSDRVKGAKSDAEKWYEENRDNLTEDKRQKLASALDAIPDDKSGKTVDELIVLLKNLYAALAEAKEPLHYRINESKLITAAATDLDGVTAVVTDMTGEKTWAVFTGNDGQDINANYTSVYDWSGKSDYSYIKFQQESENYYFITFVNAAGEEYVPRGTWHGGHGYLNVTGNGNGLFVGGNTNYTHGQDATGGALWRVDKTADGYTFYNMGLYKYAVPGIGVTSTETALKLYTAFDQFDSYTVTLNDAGYATFSSSVNTKIATEGVKAYKASVEDETITLTEIEGNIPAGTGVLLYGEDPEAEVKLTLATSGDAADVLGNDLKATTKADGTLATLEANSWALGTGNEFLHFTGTAYIHNRAYLVHEKSANSIMRIVFAEGVTTDIDNVVSKASAREGKFLENGNIVIFRNGVKYNVVGQRIK